MSSNIDQQKVFEVIAKALLIEPSEINIDTKASDHIEWDSLGHLSVLMELENSFGSSRNDEKLASCVAVREIVEILQK